MGERRFADCAARLAGMAGALLGWRPDDFWKATPTELEGVLRALTANAEPGTTACSEDVARLKEIFPDG